MDACGNGENKARRRKTCQKITKWIKGNKIDRICNLRNATQGRFSI